LLYWNTWNAAFIVNFAAG